MSTTDPFACAIAGVAATPATSPAAPAASPPRNRSRRFSIRSLTVVITQISHMGRPFGVVDAP